MINTHLSCGFRASFALPVFFKNPWKILFLRISGLILFKYWQIPFFSKAYWFPKQSSRPCLTFLIHLTCEVPLSHRVHIFIHASDSLWIKIIEPPSFFKRITSISWIIWSSRNICEIREIASNPKLIQIPYFLQDFLNKLQFLEPLISKLSSLTS